MFSELKAQGGANCAAAMTAPVAQNATYNNQNLCNKDDDFNGVGIPVFNYAFNGKDWIYSFTATQSGYQKITIGNFAAPKGIRPFLGVFHNCPSNLNLIEYRAPGIPYWTPSTGAALSITIPVYVGSSYSIVVDGHIPPPPTDDYYSNCFSFTLTMELTPFLVQNSCNNIGFEQGNLNNWMATTGQAIESFPGFTTPFYQIQNIGIGFDRHTIMSGGLDFYGGFPCVAPGLGNNSLRLGNQFSGSQAEGVSRTFVVTTENSSFTYWYAVVFQDPNHEAWEQPFFKAMLKTPDGEVINCTEFVVSAAANLPGFFNSSVNNSVRYKPWSAVNIDLSNYLGQLVTIEFTTGDCSHGAHFGYAYIDCICAPSPFLESDNQICPGSSAELTVPDGYTSYLWNPGNISAQTITVSPLVTTAYTVTVQSPNGCISEYYDTVFVAPNPVAAFNISPPACATPVSFTNTSTIPSGTINQTQWVINSSVQNTSNAQYQFPGSGMFPVTMMVTSDQGCVNSITQNVTVPSCALNVQMDNVVVCSGGCATLQVNVLDGQAPFQFNWQGINPNGSATQQVCPTNTTNYTVIVTDATGTSTSVSATVTVGAQVIVSAAANHITCSGLSNGSAIANATGGTNITYAWSNGSSGNSISGLAAGVYTVTATNSSGCQSTATLSISSPSSLEISTSTSNSTCGLSNGNIEITASGGTSPYTYSVQGMTGPFTGSNIYNSLSAGNYTTVVQDANGCQAQSNISIASIPFITAFQTNVTNPNCVGGNGSIVISNLAASQLFDIILNGNQIQNNVALPFTIQNLNAGTFEIKLIDDNNCEVSQQVILTAPTSPTSANFDITPATCGNTNGCVIIQNVTGGTAPYQYAINGGAFQASNSFCGLANGSVTVQIRDANLCVLDQNVTIATPQGLNATATVLQHVSCAGLSDGTAQVIVNDGTAPFSYVWSNGNNTNQVSGLASGEHSVVVTDGSGCSNTFQITVNAPQAISFDTQTTATTCGNNNGTLTLSNLSGVGSFSININGNAGNLINENLASGAYSIIVSDANACTANQNVNIAATPFIQNIQTTSINPTCANGNGSINITGANQTLLNADIYINNNLQAAFSAFPYQFNDLYSGAYTIKIEDINGCELEENVSLTLPIPPTSANFDITPATCGNTNGCVVIQNVTGGTAPYQYAINGGVFQASNSFCGLANGSVSVQIRDANLCVLDQNVNIIAAQGIDAEIQNVQQLSCFESNDGSASIIVNSGIAPFTYLWNTGATTTQISNLSAGDYQVTVTDNNGCSVDFNVEITQPEVITANLTFVNETCAASNASIQIVNMNGGTGNYTYSLNGNSQSTTTFENLSAGNYNIIIADENQCFISFQQTIQSIDFAQQIDISFTQPECELDNGSITINGIDFTGFNPKVSINGNQYVDLTFPFYHNNLPDNVYQISITDDNQCELTESVDIQRLSAPSGINLVLQAATCNLNNACLEVTQIQNGSAPYQYAINNGDFSFNPSFCNLAPTQVLLHVKDVNGCQTDTLVQMLAEIPVSAEVSLQQAVSCNGGSDGIVSVSIIQGQAPISILWSNGISEAVNTGLAFGNYSVVVTDGNSCTTHLEVFVPQPEALTASVERIDATCNLNNGQINIVAVSGGVSPYTYQINQEVQTNSSFYALAPSTYSVVLIDANSCQLNLGEALISMISFPEAITLEVSNASCGFPNGQIILNQVDGGISPMHVQFLGNDYIYEGESLVFPGLDEGNFSLLLTDQNGCTIQKDTALVNFQGPEFVESSVTPTTCNLDNGCIELGDVVGGNGTVQFSLNDSPFSIYPTFCSLASGDYVLVLKDILGCELPIELFVPATIPVSADAERIADVTCFGGNDGKAVSEAQVGTGPFLYNWSNGENTQYANALPAGEHTAFITDVYGCIDSSNVQIEEPLPLTIEAFAGETTCAGDSVSLFANAQGGVGQINLFWFHNGSNNASVVVHPLETTNYAVQATDENNCAVINHVVQFVNPLPTINIVSDVEKACAPACINFMTIGNNATISEFQWIINVTLSSSNPDPKFCFQSPGQISAFLMVTDTNGCKNSALAESIASLFPTPSVSFNYNPEQPNILNPTVQFNEQSTHAAFWQWDYGDGFYAYEPNPEYTFSDTGKFEVCLQVSSLQGCTNAICEGIYIKPVYTFYAPNAFTPNGDGNNDVFKLEGTYLSEVHMIIYNRWGEKLFESFDIEKGWDGTYQGKVVQDDVYTWIATIRTFDKKTLLEKGSVKVLR